MPLIELYQRRYDRSDSDFSSRQYQKSDSADLLERQLTIVDDLKSSQTHFLRLKFVKIESFMYEEV